MPLKDVWSQVSGLQHIECIDSLGKIAKELCNLEFAAFGSLYLNTANKPMEALPVDGKYCIGPHCTRQHWGCGAGKSGALSVPGERPGPCESPCRDATSRSYLISEGQNLAAYFSDLTNIAKPTVLHDKLREKSVYDHLRLLDINFEHATIHHRYRRSQGCFQADLVPP